MLAIAQRKWSPRANEVEDFQAAAGKWSDRNVGRDGRLLCGGNLKFIDQHAQVSDAT
ncbi:MAG: hypothetical protein ACLUTZ_11055 [Oliverpabstia sp.]